MFSFDSKNRINQIIDRNIYKTFVLLIKDIFQKKQISKKNVFLNNLKTVASKNDYSVDKTTSNNPEVILIGDYHPNNIIWFSNNIEKILDNIVDDNDTILMEGTEGEVIYPLFNHKEFPIYNIISNLEKKNIKSYFNDSWDLVQQHKIVREIMQRSYESGHIEGNRQAIF